MLDDIATDFAQHHWTAALVTTLTILAGLSTQGRIQPFLARLSAWQKTLALAAILGGGIGAQAYSSGLGVTVACFRAAVPIASLLATRYLGVSKDPAADHATAAVNAAMLSEKQNPTSLASKLASSSLPMLLVTAVFALTNLGASCTPPTQVQDATVLDAGCALIPVFDPNGGALIGTICESLVPVVTTILTDLLKAAKPASSADAGALAFTAVTHGGKNVGAVRADLAVAAQAKLDALP